MTPKRAFDRARGPHSRANSFRVSTSVGPTRSAPRSARFPRTAFFDPERNLFPDVWLPDGTALVTDRKADPQNLVVVTLADGTIAPYRPAGFSGRDASVSRLE